LGEKNNTLKEARKTTLKKGENGLMVGYKASEITFLFHWLVRLRERLMNGVAESSGVLSD